MALKEAEIIEVTAGVGSKVDHNIPGPCQPLCSPTACVPGLLPLPCHPSCFPVLIPPTPPKPNQKIFGLVKRILNQVRGQYVMSILPYTMAKVWGSLLGSNTESSLSKSFFFSSDVSFSSQFWANKSRFLLCLGQKSSLAQYSVQEANSSLIPSIQGIQRWILGVFLCFL